MNATDSKLFTINFKDVSKALIMAILSGALLPVMAVIQTPEFDITRINWSMIGMLALNGAFLGFVSYIVKNFFSDKQGKVLGVIG